MNPAMFRLARQSESVVDRFRELQSSVRSKYPQSYVNRGYAFWTREIDAQGIETLPFFSEKANPGFSAEDFHPTYHALRELASMGLFRKTTLSGMQAAGITVLSDLLLLTPRQIAIFPAQRIEWYRERIKAFLLGGTVRLDTSSPETFVRSMLGAVLVPTAGNKQRVECVVLKLLGHTLAEISRRYGKSRERIRQYYT